MSSAEARAKAKTNVSLWPVRVKSKTTASGRK
jgi:hypothetical protein